MGPRCSCLDLVESLFNKAAAKACPSIALPSEAATAQEARLLPRNCLESSLAAASLSAHRLTSGQSSAETSLSNWR